jgi:hypothetical protein
MRVALLEDMTNGVRLPVERRHRPTLGRLRNYRRPETAFESGTDRSARVAGTAQSAPNADSPIHQKYRSLPDPKGLRAKK